MEDRSASLPGPATGVEHLLSPSLAAAPARKPLYSVRAGFLVAFFGGVYATLCLSALNSWRAGRLMKDLWVYGLAAAAWSAVMAMVGYGLAADSLPDWLGLAGPYKRTLRWGGRLLALALFGAVYLRHRPLIKAQELFGGDPPNPWPAGLLALAVAAILTVAFAGLGAALGLR